MLKRCIDLRAPWSLSVSLTNRVDIDVFDTPAVQGLLFFSIPRIRYRGAVCAVCGRWDFGKEVEGKKVKA